MKHLAVILARGGSRRVPRKNAMPFCGRPMVHWTIQAAIESGRFCRVLVSTDDEEIARLARDAGAEVPFLRKGCADDQSPASAATLEALNGADQHWDCAFATVTQLMASCPLRTAADIVRCHQSFLTIPSRSLISCVPLVGANAWWAVTLDAEGAPIPLHPQARVSRSQDLPELFAPTGAVWCSGTSELRANGTFYSEGHRYFPIDWVSGVDIDTWDDLELASACYRTRLQGLGANCANRGTRARVKSETETSPSVRATTSARGALLALLHRQPPIVQHYFRSLEVIFADDCPLEAGLAWTFSMQECVQRRALKLVRECGRGLGQYASRELRRRTECERLLRREAEAELRQALGCERTPVMSDTASGVRNDVLHGRRVGATQIQQACAEAITWCATIDELVRAKVGHGPLEDLRRRPHRA